MAESRKPLLELDTLIEPEVVGIDGQSYPLVNLLALSITEEARLKKKLVANSKESQKLLEGDPTEEDIERAQQLFDENVRLVLQVPDEVFVKLKTVHKAKILEAFLSPPAALAPQPSTGIAPEGPAPTTSTGESKSPDSSASTVATP